MAQTGCSGWDTQFTLPNGVSDAVYSLAVSGSDIYIGGDFTAAGNVSANRVAKFNTLTNTWSALGNGGGNGVDDVVLALAVIGSDLYVGGSFTTANVGGPSLSTNRVAKVNSATGVWNALGTGSGNGRPLEVRKPVSLPRDKAMIATINQWYDRRMFGAGTRGNTAFSNYG